MSAPRLLLPSGWLGRCSAAGGALGSRFKKKKKKSFLDLINCNNPLPRRSGKEERESPISPSAFQRLAPTPHPCFPPFFSTSFSFPPLAPGAAARVSSGEGRARTLPSWPQLAALRAARDFGQRSAAPAEQKKPLSRKGWGAALGWPGPCSCTGPVPPPPPLPPGWPFPVPRVRARLPVFLEILEKPGEGKRETALRFPALPASFPRSPSPFFLFFFFLLNFIPRRPRCGGSLSPPQGRRCPARSGAHGAVFREAFACSSLPRRMLPGLFWLLFFAGDEGSALKMEMICFLFLSLVPVYSRGQGVYGKRHCRGRWGGRGGEDEAQAAAVGSKLKSTCRRK